MAFKKILVIDDNDDDLLMITECLVEADPSTEVITALDGEEGIRISIQERPEVVIIDTTLPGIDGFETCRRIRSGDAEVMIIVMTGQVNAVNAGKAREAGTDEYCVKTSDCEDLLNALRDVTSP